MLQEGVEEASAREQARIVRRIWDYQLSSNPTDREAIEEALSQWVARRDSKLPVVIDEVSEGRRAKISYDPTTYLDRLTVPTLYVYGSEDVNVPTKECVDRLEELAANGRPVSWHVYEGAGHELGSVRIFPPGYSFVEGYSDLLGEFADRQVSHFH